MSTALKCPHDWSIECYDYDRISGVVLTVFGRCFGRHWPTMEVKMANDVMCGMASDQILDDFWRFIGAE